MSPLFRKRSPQAGTDAAPAPAPAAPPPAAAPPFDAAAPPAWPGSGPVTSVAPSAVTAPASGVPAVAGGASGGQGAPPPASAPAAAGGSSQTGASQTGAAGQAAPAPAAAGVPEDWPQLLRTMIIVRSFDDEVVAAFAHAGGVTAPERCNEGVVAVLGSLLRPGDTVASSEPAHLSVLAGGAPLAATLAELLTLPQGLCGGKSGPAELIDAERAAFGVDEPLGKAPELGAGAALATQVLGQPGVTVAVVGPQTVRSGALDGALAMIAEWRLPAVVVVTRRGEPGADAEAPDGGTGGAVPPGIGGPDGAPYSAAGVERIVVDRDDVLALREAMARAIERARSGAGPTLVEALVARPTDQAPGGAPGSVPADPILRLALAVLRSGAAMPEALDELRDRSRAEVRAARDLVRSWAAAPAAPVAGSAAESLSAGATPAAPAEPEPPGGHPAPPPFASSPPVPPPPPPPAPSWVRPPASQTDGPADRGVSP